MFVRASLAFLLIFVVGGSALLLADTRELGEGYLETAQPTSAIASTVPTIPPQTVAVIETSVPVVAADVPRSGSGEFLGAASSSPAVGVGEIIEYSVAVEDGIDLDPEAVASFVEEVLADERSWIHEGTIGFRRIEQGGLFTVVVATPDTVDHLCRPLTTNGNFSCARNGWVAINLVRWLTATDTWAADLTLYRQYVINHEIGHYLGRPHVECPGAGLSAPVMMQQTKGVGSCVENGWPYPGS